MKLLLVEDNRELSFWMTRLLEQSGYAVEQAFSGGDAIQFLMTQSYDAILLDLMLPDMKGQVVLKRIRDRHNDVPVLIVSAQDALHDIIGHLDLGADDDLVKPVNILELEARLRSLLRRSTGKTVSKKDLTDGLFTLEDTVSEKALEIYIVRLRKKIENTGAQIVTLRGLGYMLTAYAPE